MPPNNRKKTQREDTNNAARCLKKVLQIYWFSFLFLKSKYKDVSITGKSSYWSLEESRCCTTALQIYSTRAAVFYMYHFTVARQLWKKTDRKDDCDVSQTTEFIWNMCGRNGSEVLKWNLGLCRLEYFSKAWQYAHASRRLRHTGGEGEDSQFVHTSGVK